MSKRLKVLIGLLVAALVVLAVVVVKPAVQEGRLQLRRVSREQAAKKIIPERLPQISRRPTPPEAAELTRSEILPRDLADLEIELKYDGLDSEGTSYKYGVMVKNIGEVVAGRFGISCFGINADGVEVSNGPRGNPTICHPLNGIVFGTGSRMLEPGESHMAGPFSIRNDISLKGIKAQITHIEGPGTGYSEWLERNYDNNSIIEYFPE